MAKLSSNKLKKLEKELNKAKENAEYLFDEELNEAIDLQEDIDQAETWINLLKDTKNAGIPVYIDEDNYDGIIKVKSYDVGDLSLTLDLFVDDALKLKKALISEDDGSIKTFFKTYDFNELSLEDRVEIITPLYNKVKNTLKKLNENKPSDFVPIGKEANYDPHKVINYEMNIKHSNLNALKEGLLEVLTLKHGNIIDHYKLNEKKPYLHDRIIKEPIKDDTGEGVKETQLFYNANGELSFKNENIFYDFSTYLIHYSEKEL